MPEVNGYEHDDKWNGVSNADWLFATKKGEEYFLKKFRFPKYPSSQQSEKGQQSQIRECQEWLEARKAVNKALQSVSSGSGNIVTPQEIFLHKSSYFQSTRKVNTDTIPMEELYHIPTRELLFMISTLFNAMKKVHSVNVIHGDLKPDNIIVERHASKLTGKTNIVCKIIDFDDSYFSQKPPLPEDTVGTEAYWSPELAFYKLQGKTESKKLLTCKSDVFALGLIIHQYCTGGKFPELDGIKYAYQILSNKQILKADKSIQPLALQDIINRMLALSPNKRPSMEELCVEVQTLRNELENTSEEEKKTETVQERKIETLQEQEICTVTIKNRLPEAGTATVNGKTTVTVKKGERVNLQAREQQGYEFIQWQVGRAVGKKSTYEVKIPGDITIEAVFEKLSDEWKPGKKEGFFYRERHNGKLEFKHPAGGRYTLDRWQAEGMGWI